MIKSILYNTLPITRIKIFIAKILYKTIVPFYGKKPRIIERNGIKFEVDLSEGVDLSLFIFGNFQSHVTQSEYMHIVPNAIVVDIGANFGLMALPFAKAVPQGHVFAFEPTHYALSKLRRNIELNPELKERITIINSFVSTETTSKPDIKAFSSWKVDGEKADIMHPVHQGAAKSTEGVPSITLDDFCTANAIKQLDFIKIDTDGHEYEVFKGAKQAMAKYRPKVIFEIGRYVMKEKGIDFSFYSNYFNELSYKLLDSNTGAQITLDNYLKHIPSKGTIDILAIPI